MAIAKSGPNGPYSGKIGATVAYIVNGKTYIRALAHPSTKPRTIKQLANEQRMTVLSPFLNLIKLYIRVGFQLAAQINGNQPCQSARSYNLKNAIKGTYPHQEINYPAIRLSEGNLPEPLNPVVESLSDGLKFSWDKDTLIPNSSPYDRTMILVWFPEKKAFFQIIDGAQRQAQEDFVAIPPNFKGLYAETYISFITNDRRQISNSVYTGRLQY